jgi:hypothetical protein
MLAEKFLKIIDDDMFVVIQMVAYCKERVQNTFLG